MDHPMTRRDFLLATGAAALGLGAAEGAAQQRRDGTLVYVGTYSTRGSRGIYTCRMDPDTGALRVVGTTASENPSFLALHPTQRYLYAVNETTEYRGEKSGAVTAYAIDGRTGALRALSQQSSRGGAPCHVTVDRAGRWVLVANYAGGNGSLLPVRADGALEPAKQVVQDRGSGPNRTRQEGPHAHSFTLDAANRFAVLADLGIDRLMVFRFDAREGRLTPAAVPEVRLAPGAGPRHFAFHPDGRHAYVVNELVSTVTLFDYDPERGSLRERQTAPLLPTGFRQRSTAADVHVSADGRFLYASNRGHDSITVFALEPRTGRLSLVEHHPTGGQNPRNFAIDPTGRFLLAANQRSDHIVTFRIDPGTGRLRPTGSVVQIPSPVCVRFTTL